MTLVKYRRLTATFLMLCYFFMASHWGSVLSVKGFDKLASFQGEVLDFVSFFQETERVQGVLFCNNPDTYIYDRLQDAEMIAQMTEEAGIFKVKHGASCGSESSCCCAQHSFNESPCACSRDKKRGVSGFVLNDPCDSQETFELSLKNSDRPARLNYVLLGSYVSSSLVIPISKLLEQDYEGSFIAELGKVPISA